MKKEIILVVAIIAALIGIIIGLYAYSYSQIQVSFTEVSSVAITLEELSLSSILQLGIDALSGNWMQAALDLIGGIDLGLVFALTNNGLLPVYIPELTYNLSINGIPMGEGTNLINETINPGETKEIEIIQNFQKSSFNPAVASIIDSEGLLDVRVKGTAYFELLGQTIPVPFESTKQISLVDEIQKEWDQLISN